MHSSRTNQAMSAEIMRGRTRTSCSWPPWECARTSRFKCMPKGISGLFRGCTPPYHMRESSLRILLTLTQRLEWWIGSKWRAPSLDLSEEQQHRLLEIASRCPIHHMLVSQVQIQTRLIVPTSLKQ